VTVDEVELKPRWSRHRMVGRAASIAAVLKHKSQHFIPRSYLAAWRDPETPEGQEPYVWRFSKDGSQSKNKAPQNIFTETDA
jgi:hypothetical protein